MSDSPDVAQLQDSIERLRATVDARLAEDPAREEAIRKLHAELTDYKQGFLAEAEKPFLLDLLLLYDSMSWFQKTVIETETSKEVLADSFQFLMDELLETLYRRDVVPMEAGGAFDPSVHKAVRTEPTHDPAEDNAITQVVKRGFVRHNKPLRPEEVVVAKFKSTDDEGA